MMQHVILLILERNQEINKSTNQQINKSTNQQIDLEIIQNSQLLKNSWSDENNDPTKIITNFYQLMKIIHIL